MNFANTKSNDGFMANRELYISEDDFQDLNDKLSDFVQTAEARCALLVDKSGYLIVAKGHFSFIAPDDLGVMAAGAFSALCNMVDIAAAHVTTNFHFPGTETLHFAIVNPQVFLVVFYKAEADETREKREEIMKMTQDFVREIKPVFGKKDVDVRGWGSLDFINEKIDEIFDKDV